jgi:hypothetical protein
MNIKHPARLTPDAPMSDKQQSRYKRIGWKPRGDSPLTRVTAERADEIQDYLLTHTLDETVAWLREAGVVTSQTALSNWLARRRIETALARNRSTSEALMQRTRERHPEWSEEQLQEAGQMFFTELAIHQEDPQIWRITQQLRIAQENLDAKHRGLALQERRIKLLEEKAAQSEETRKVLSAPINAEEQLARIRQVYGI